MTLPQAVILALVQAITEFLPISSSGHLILVPRLLHWSDQRLEFDIATNTGTLLAVILYFRHELLRIAGSILKSLRERTAGDAEARLGWSLVVGTVPAAIVGLALEHWIATAARSWRLIAWNAAIWGVVLILADLAGRKRRGLAEIGPRTGLAIGCAQALALIPGTSRSGVTMSAALGLGFDRDTAARFSFLLSVPVGILVAAKQGLDIVRGVPLGVPASSLVVGIAVSAIAGYGVIAFLLGWVRRHSLWVFGVYRLLLAGFLFYYLS
ncbi:MAG TPA: undecaprenyl-diphosphate phosphatase [Gaiellaceae bacterium]|nr:undecaprenyl-diphosphate phosphatase [Gaiellaceae bacterium]